ncbi:unnamed protein product [Vitrella brassicaformis CCMP3155]|uniref:MPN domain-containing protein n=1 Tax=Vitrella brassicaformis (strain CCMP3155) TaxID=1169540 RepID=A0A0G4GW27_VITBC|nr:unnamed protein product [Vitrella brassicaformis CCMP3155]|mmetsp:Transcript_40433/g.101157  ORF Transcript_40433/g.101157 Transcript_40433/m.101157 type:complete len:241 (+) Transcript_40433:154-876(+)|eukprot:CEM35087.1 unnamed protein product [Vitrella brassicaformis CCMP3155]
MPERSYRFSSAAYSKILSHASKYSCSTVGGVLVGRSEGKGGEVTYTDAFPLFHTSILPPLLKVAFSLIEQYCKQEGVTLCGYYQANADATTTMNVVSKAIADRLTANCNFAAVFMLDAEKVPEGQPALKCYAGSRGDWSSVSASRVHIGEDVIDSAGEYISSERYVDIVDFDNHFECPELDWTNPEFTPTTTATTADEGESARRRRPRGSREGVTEGMGEGGQEGGGNDGHSDSTRALVD